ncbi:MAG: 3'(2'),5'-bisphosphate nucleotidase CysQ [Bradyrhizobiaceae bacterium]|nr:3'(2'),5'-bisphosphate nucleotidase CysQ [Bradyrhizobiaceae bacterium]
MDTADKLLALADALEGVVREAGALARKAFGTRVRTWLKEHDSPVSEVDIAVNELLRERLTALVPEAGWLSEESEDDPARLEAGRVWIVDPIDGTRAFIGGRPDWTVSVALVEAGRPLVAALYAPVTVEFFRAAAGTGATCNGAPIAATTGDAVADARLSGPKGILDRLATVVPRFAVLPRIHSLALRLARVADGTLDAAFASSTSRDWDLAAADLLVHEAGGALTTLDGITPAYNGASTVQGALVAAGRLRHRALTGLLGGSR